jgi:predicted dehydrogenase
LKDNLNAGVIGLGVGESHIMGLQAHPRCKVIALCDLNEEVLKTVGQRYSSCQLTVDPLSILEDPNIDIVCIASYDDSHEFQVLRALRNNKHVFVEKPLCLSGEELKNIADELNFRPQLSFSSNHILRKTPRFVELKERISSNRLGEIFHMEGSYDYGRLHKLTDGWRGQIPHYSVTLGGGIHIIDLMLWLSGKKVSSAFSKGNNISSSSSQFKGRSLTTSILQFEDESTAQITSNFASVAPHHHKLSLYGTSGTFEQSHCGANYYWSRDPLEEREEVSSAYPGAAKGDLIINFIDSIFSKDPPLVSKQEVLDVISVCLAIDQSITSSSPQKVVYHNVS